MKNKDMSMGEWLVEIFSEIERNPCAQRDLIEKFGLSMEDFYKVSRPIKILTDNGLIEPYSTLAPQGKGRRKILLRIKNRTSLVDEAMNMISLLEYVLETKRLADYTIQICIKRIKQAIIQMDKQNNMPMALA